MEPPKPPVKMEPPVGSTINTEECFQFFDVCYCCQEQESLAHPLKRCSGCQLVAYCSRDCQKLDRPSHKRICKEFPVVNGKNVLHTTGPWMEHISGLRKRAAKFQNLATMGMTPPVFRNPRVCNTCREAHPNRLIDCTCGGVCWCSKVCMDADKSHKGDCSYLRYVSDSYYTSFRSMSYPLSLKYALDSLPKHSFGRDLIPIKERITLTIHIVSSGRVFDTVPWEELMHDFPKLNQLKLDFIVQAKYKVCKTSINYDNKFSQHPTQQRCKDCETKDRIITYSAHQMPYHMYFSSVKYTEPDVVVIYGNKQEMLENDDGGDIHTNLSYCNMINSPDTVLILMDATEDLLREGNIKVHNAQPIDELVVPQINKLRGCGSLAAKPTSDGSPVNDKYYFTCLRKQV